MQYIKQLGTNLLLTGYADGSYWLHKQGTYLVLAGHAQGTNVAPYLVGSRYAHIGYYKTRGLKSKEMLENCFWCCCSIEVKTGTIYVLSDAFSEIFCFMLRYLA